MDGERTGRPSGQSSHMAKWQLTYSSAFFTPEGKLGISLSPFPLTQEWCHREAQYALVSRPISLLALWLHGLGMSECNFSPSPHDFIAPTNYFTRSPLSSFPPALFSIFEHLTLTAKKILMIKWGPPKLGAFSLAKFLIPQVQWSIESRPRNSPWTPHVLRNGYDHTFISGLSSLYSPSGFI